MFGNFKINTQRLYFNNYLISSISREEFVEISQAIVSLFPSEVAETYYKPSYRTNPPQGKLYTAYSKYRVLLRESSLVCKRVRTIRSNTGKSIII